MGSVHTARTDWAVTVLYFRCSQSSRDAAARDNERVVELGRLVAGQFS